MPANEISKLLRIVAEIAESNDLERIKFATQALTAERNKIRKGKKENDKEGLKPALNFEVDDVINKLLSVSNRDEGRRLLSEMKLTKRELNSIGRKANVYVIKGDRNVEIEEKIVESLIGSRLNSIAIRGEGK